MAVSIPVDGVYFRGFIDEVKIYPYSRTPTEIRMDYASGRAGIKSNHGVIASFGSQSDSWMTDGLVGYWAMDESATTSGAIDQSGNGNDGTYEGHASTSAGKFGNSGVFDGVDDYINVGSGTALDDVVNAGALTVSWWMKPDSGDSGDRIIGKDTEGGSGAWNIYVSSGSSNRITFNKDISGTDPNASFDSTIIDNEWQHIVMMWDGTNNANGTAIKLYRNGTEISPVSTAGGGTVGRSDSSNDLIVGGFSNDFDGQIDEVRIYNRALSPREVRMLYEWAPGPVAHWRFDELTGDTAYDSAASTTHAGGNHGQLGSAAGADSADPTWSNFGKYGGALEFDGVDDYVDFNNYINNDNLTFSAWINKQGNGLDMPFVSNLWGDTTYGLAEIWNDSDIYINPNSFLQTTYAINLNKWYNFTFTQEGAITTVYVDGVYVDSASTGIPSKGTTGIEIGRHFGGSDYWNGLIDDVRIYNYARTQKQILEDMNA
ncbi:MAG: LamG domain-containing protein, partial [bacterium]|nr:LamG domain-containing protein [bacterium]